MPNEPHLVLDEHALLGEGAIWDSAAALLYWVDIEGSTVHIFDPATGSDHAIDVRQQVGTVVPRRSGGLVLALADGFAHLDLDTEQLTPLWELPEDNRFNDGKCDPAGRLWAGTIGPAGSANLYCLFADLHVEHKLDGITTSNGICWSHDAKTMYYIDTRTQTVAAFAHDAQSSAIGPRRVAVTVPKEMGHPDGMTIDAEGMLWVAMWDGWSVTRWDPASGRLLDTIPLPAARVTSCAFGGPDLGTLYITTARTGLDKGALREQPHAGGLFRLTPGVRGVAAVPFAG